MNLTAGKEDFEQQPFSWKKFWTNTKYSKVSLVKNVLQLKIVGFSLDLEVAPKTSLAGLGLRVTALPDAK